MNEANSVLDLDKLESSKKRQELRDKVALLIRDKEWLNHERKIVIQSQRQSLWDKLTRSGDRRLRQTIDEISAIDYNLKIISQTIYQSETAERQIHGAKFNELVNALKQVGVATSRDFEIRYDLSTFTNEKDVHNLLATNTKDNLSSKNNATFFIYIDGRTINFSGQSIFLHKRNGYEESLFLRLLDNLKAEDKLQVVGPVTTSDIAGTYYTDTYEALFAWNGWVLKTNARFDYDITIAPSDLDREGVLQELEIYRSGKEENG